MFEKSPAGADPRESSAKAMDSAKAETRLSVRRVSSDREWWWRETTWDQNNGDSDDSADFDARVFW